MISHIKHGVMHLNVQRYNQIMYLWTKTTSFLTLINGPFVHFFLFSHLPKSARENLKTVLEKMVLRGPVQTQYFIFCENFPKMNVYVMTYKALRVLQVKGK